MRDKSLGIFLMVLFGVLSITILTLAWVRPMPELEKGMTAFMGLVGLFVALGQARLLKSPKAGTGAEPALMEIDVKDKP